MSTSVWIMCGGPSASKRLDVKGDMIAVNKDIFRYPKANYFITMDNRFNNWELHEPNRRLPSDPTKIFVVDMSSDLIRHTKSFFDRRWGMSFDLSQYDMILKSYSASGFGKTFKDFSHGHSSGYCALQLAIVLGYTEIHLVGLDLCTTDKTHWHEGYPKSKDDAPVNLDAQFKLFEIAIPCLKGVRIISHSPISRLNSLKGVEFVKLDAADGHV